MLPYFTNSLVNWSDISPMHWSINSIRPIHPSMHIRGTWQIRLQVALIIQQAVFTSPTHFHPAKIRSQINLPQNRRSEASGSQQARCWLTEIKRRSTSPAIVPPSLPASLNPRGDLHTDRQPHVNFSLVACPLYLFGLLLVMCIMFVCMQVAQLTTLRVCVLCPYYFYVRERKGEDR